jgi:SAM-dependent methyltransferase
MTQLGSVFVSGDQEDPGCELCGAPSSESIVVGTKARFGMSVRNVACGTCGLVYIAPRPTPEAMSAYYRGEYRQHYGNVKISGVDGKFVGPGEPGYDAAIERNHRNQAEAVARFVDLKAGDNVLEIGCRDARTLSMLRDAHGIVPQGVEPGGDEVAQAEARGVTCFNGLLGEFDPAGRKFRLIQLFHVLEHFHEPVAELRRIRSLLAPGGQVFIEVPNVCQPYGLLEENFFQNAHLFNFSANTLSAILRKAGFAVQTMVDAHVVYAVATPDPSAAEDMAFSRALLPRPEEDGAWIALRLKTYAQLEKLRVAFLRGAAAGDVVAVMSRLLPFPMFQTHATNVVCEVVQGLVKRGHREEARVLAAAASKSTPDEGLREGFARMAAVA